MEGHKIKFGITMRLIIILLIAIAMLGGIITTISATNMKHSINEREKESLRNSAYAIKNAYFALYGGDLSKLSSYANLGSENSEDLISTDVVSSATSISEVDGVSSATKEVLDAVTIMDTFNQETKIEVTVYWGDTVALTTFKDAGGNRLIGNKIEEEVGRQVIDLSEDYFKEDIVINEHSHFAYYIPLTKDGIVLGAIGVAKNSEVVRKLVNDAISRIIIIEVIISVLLGVFALITLIKISNSIKYASQVLHGITNGDLTIVIKDDLLKRKDEVGVLGLCAEQLRNELSEIIKSISLSIDDLGSSADIMDNSTNKTRVSYEWLIITCVV